MQPQINPKLSTRILQEYIPSLQPHISNHSSEHNPLPSVQACGESSEILQENTTRKPRGRPPGSKNKPKTPIVITRDNDSVIKPAVLKIPAGFDVTENIINFARIMSIATGSVSDVILRYPSSQGAPYRFVGTFKILSLSGSFFADHSTTPTPCSSFNIILSGEQIQF
ncbi:AT-hook motif nuclear-localized protein 17-like [Gossypium australe]|uniref:AT-hook motif nuclear-localized protein 17-like n=1 Tax=Gossypium australe TaxID=47621 RepID=A0A5B6UPJ7_9ROSI|nr:AT-hook motif nuclear-localized protein 17-like [Gossypium australe]